MRTETTVLSLSRSNTAAIRFSEATESAGEKINQRGVLIMAGKTAVLVPMDAAFHAIEHACFTEETNPVSDRQTGCWLESANQQAIHNQDLENKRNSRNFCQISVSPSRITCENKFERRHINPFTAMKSFENNQ